jgi:hypothetical protein
MLEAEFSEFEARLSMFSICDHGGVNCSVCAQVFHLQTRVETPAWYTTDIQQWWPFVMMVAIDGKSWEGCEACPHYMDGPDFCTSLTLTLNLAFLPYQDESVQPLNRQ